MPAITAIYRHHVLHGLATFEIDPPDETEMARRFAAIRELGLPYFTAEIDGRVAAVERSGAVEVIGAIRIVELQAGAVSRGKRAGLEGQGTAVAT